MVPLPGCGPGRALSPDRRSRAAKPPLSGWADGGARTVRLSQVAEVRPATGPNQINRRDLNREINIDANALGRSAGEVSDDIRRVLAETALPPGYRTTFGGSTKNMQESFSYAVGALALAVVFIYMILASQFKSFLQPLALMSSLPLTLIGVVLSLLLFRSTLNMFSIIGVVMLMGTNDLEEGAAPEAIAANVKAIVAAIEAKNPRTPIVLCQVFPSASEKQRPAEKIKEVNRLVAEGVKGDPRVRLVDTWTLFADAKADAKPEEFPDLLHPNDAGYARWAAAIRPVLETLELVPAPVDDFQCEPGFEMLFNGRDLTGWGYRDQPTLGRQLDLDGRTSSPDGRYVVRHGRIVVTTPPEGRRVEQLWTTRELTGNFILKLEFRATPTADSGVFIRAPQLQCRDYLLAGPYKELKHYKPQDWNELIVTVIDGKAMCRCHDEILEVALPVPASGPIGLEGDSGQLEYRRIRIAKVPPVSGE